MVVCSVQRDEEWSVEGILNVRLQNCMNRTERKSKKSEAKGDQASLVSGKQSFRERLGVFAF